MAADGPPVQRPKSPLWTIAGFVGGGVLLFLAAWGGFDLAWRVSPWFGP